MLLPPLPGMRTLGMGMAGLATGGAAFTAGVALGVGLGAAGACAAWAACRMLRGRGGRWRDEHRGGGMAAGGPHPGEEGPQLPIGEAPVV